MTISIALLLACIGESVDDSTSTTDTEQSSDDTGTGDTGNKDTGSSDTGTEDTGVEDTGVKDTGAPPEPLERFSGDYELLAAPGRIRGVRGEVTVGRYAAAGGENQYGVNTFWLNAPTTGAVYAFEQGLSGEHTAEAADLGLERPEGPGDGYFGLDAEGGLDVTGNGHADLVVAAPSYGGITTVTLFEGPVSASSEPIATVSEPAGDFYSEVTVLQAAQPQVVMTSGTGLAVFLFDQPSGALEPSDHDAILTGPVSPSMDVDRAGDLNGDGLDDLLVTSLDRVYVVMGPVAGSQLLDDSDAVLVADPTSTLVKANGVGAGDVDGDGLADILVGTPYSADGQGGAGLFVGQVSGTLSVSSADVLLEYSGSGEANLGYSADAAGDVDADGHGDLILGAPNYVDVDGGGEAFLWYGPLSSGVYKSGDADARFYSAAGGAGFGTLVLGLGDISGDGGSDLLIGAPLHLNAGESGYGSGMIGVWSL
ncbi:MAG: VCBS repeat-containing protein [Myxococcota bacterium]|nr:VCBS repeat-containing protein [Myxococcota bacterium]